MKMMMATTMIMMTSSFSWLFSTLKYSSSQIWINLPDEPIINSGVTQNYQPVIPEVFAVKLQHVISWRYRIACNNKMYHVYSCISTTNPVGIVLPTCIIPIIKIHMIYMYAYDMDRLCIPSVVDHLTSDRWRCSLWSSKWCLGMIVFISTLLVWSGDENFP